MENHAISLNNKANITDVQDTINWVNWKKGLNWFYSNNREGGALNTNQEGSAGGLYLTPGFYFLWTHVFMPSTTMQAGASFYRIYNFIEISTTPSGRVTTGTVSQTVPTRNEVQMSTFTFFNLEIASNVWCYIVPSFNLSAGWFGTMNAYPLIQL